MQLIDLRAPVQQELQQTDILINTQIESPIRLIPQVGQHLIGSGGKRLRPLIAILSAKACGYEGEHHVTLGTILEFVHTATLLHDDVVDTSKMRRGQETANQIWGNSASVLVGDYFYSRSFQLMVKIQDMRVLEILAAATNVIASGEIQQLMNCRNPDISEQQYLAVIYQKTAKLFEVGSQLGAVLAKATPEIESAMASYGQYLGTAFQLVDDMLDYNASPEELGKNIGDDLAEGKPTLPLIYAMSAGTTQQRDLIRDAIKQGSLDNLADIQAAIHATGALDYTQQVAQQQVEKAQQALTLLPESTYKQSLWGLAQFAIARRS